MRRRMRLREENPVKYEAHITGREGRWWAITIPALGEDAQTQARRIDDVADEARDYLAVTLDVAPSSIEVEVIIDDIGNARMISPASPGTASNASAT